MPTKAVASAPRAARVVPGSNACCSVWSTATEPLRIWRNSSISCGERITFQNQEMNITNAAAAALTERVRVFVNLVVLPMHPIPLIAKQIATRDVLSGGRVTLGVGIGGREHDYLAMGSTMDRRHQRLDDGVAYLIGAER